MIAQGRVRRPVRSLFVSDVHLGCRHSQAESLHHFLEAHQPEYLYLVGDFIDGWKLKRSWRWHTVYNRIFERLIEMKGQGTRLFYTPGNHDEFLREFLYDFGLVDINDEFVHVGADRTRYLVIHGDKYDRFERSARWLSVSASILYDVLLSANRWVHRFRRGSQSPYAFSAGLKQRVKYIVQLLSDFEGQLVAHAKARRCQGVICGHIHAPKIAQWGDVKYCNTGDWVEHCTALIEHGDGRIELVSHDSSGTTRSISHGGQHLNQAADDACHCMDASEWTDDTRQLMGAGVD